MVLGTGSRHWEWTLGVGPGPWAGAAQQVPRATEPIMKLILWPPDVYIRRRLLAKAVVCAPSLHLTSLALDFMEIINLLISLNYF